MEFCNGIVSLFHTRRHATTAAFRSIPGTIILKTAHIQHYTAKMRRTRGPLVPFTPTNAKTDRQTETDSQTGRQADRQTDRQTH